MSDFDLQWIPQYLGQPKVIFDIGSYDAADSMRFKTAYPQCRVIAFEASPEMFSWIQNERKEIELYHYAITDQCGTIRFQQSGSIHGDSGSGSIFPPNENLAREHPHLKFKAPVEVPTTTISAFCEQHKIESFDVAHIDIQGAEWYALKGFGALRPKIIFLEVCETTHYTGAKSKEGLFQLLVDMGYTRRWGTSQDELWVLK